jgi:hypothetical protein
VRSLLIITTLLLTASPVAVAGKCHPYERVKEQIAAVERHNQQALESQLQSMNAELVPLEQGVAEPRFSPGAAFVAAPEEVGIAAGKSEGAALIIAGSYRHQPSLLFAEQTDRVYRVVAEAKGRLRRFAVCGCPPNTVGGARQPIQQSFYRVPEGKAFAGELRYPARPLEIRYSQHHACPMKP